MSQLSRRIAVAIWGIPLIVVITLIGGVLFALFVAIICCLAANEFYRLADAKGANVSLGIIWASLLPLIIHFKQDLALPFLAVGALVICLMLPFQPLDDLFKKLGVSLAGIIYPALLLSFLVIIRNEWDKHYYGAIVILFIMTTCWICDTAAYFGGSKLGKRKLAPIVSPNKTWEGAIIGLLAALFWAAIVGQFIGFVLSVTECIIGALIIGTFGQLSDLAESAIKRSVQVKDTASLLGPHGGVMDRFDSLFASAPIFYLLLKITGKI